MSSKPTSLRAVPAPEAALSMASMAQMVRRFDGWANLLTGLGTTRDKRTATTIQTTVRLPYEVLVDLYRSEPFAAKGVNLPVEDMVRKWFEVKIEGEKDAGEAIDGWLRELAAPPAFKLALEWKRAYGGAGILLGINNEVLDSRRLSQPLNPGDIRKITHLTVFSCRELQAAAYYSEPQRPNFGKPAIYRIVPQVPFGISGQRITTFGASYVPQGESMPTVPWAVLPEVHESRILQFDGVVVDRRQRLQNWGWGDSVLQRVYELLRDFGGSLAGIAHLLEDFAQAILKIPGLAAALASDEDNKIIRRAELIDMTRSIAKMVLLDGGEESTGLGAEEFKRETTSLTSVPEAIDRLAMAVAGAMDIPITRLFGQSPKGLGNEGESDRDNWNDHVAHLQQIDAEPQARRLITLAMQSTEGPLKGVTRKTAEKLQRKLDAAPPLSSAAAEAAGTENPIPKTWSIGWLPLRQLTEKEEADLRKTTAETDEINVRSGVLSPDEARQSHFGGDAFSQEIQLNTEARTAFADTDPGEGETVCPECGKSAAPGKPCPACKAMVPAPQLTDPLGEGADMPQPTGEGGSSAAAQGPDLQQLALNGTQITGLLAILAAVRDGSLPQASAVQALLISFPAQIDEARAKKLVEPIEVKEPPEPPDPIELAKAKAAGGGTFPPGKPGAEPPGKGAPPVPPKAAKPPPTVKPSDGDPA